METSQTEAQTLNQQMFSALEIFLSLGTEISVSG